MGLKVIHSKVPSSAKISPRPGKTKKYFSCRNVLKRFKFFINQWRRKTGNRMELIIVFLDIFCHARIFSNYWANRVIYTEIMLRLVKLFSNKNYVSINLLLIITFQSIYFWFLLITFFSKGTLFWPQTLIF